jgi:type II secretory pathway pseudopilin PulG
VVIMMGKAEHGTRFRILAQEGFTYLWVLFMVAALGTALGAAAELWSTEQQREKERELLFVGDQFRQAIKGYYLQTAGAAKGYPPTLDALLKDPRVPGVRRYLRQVYLDPITGSAEWGLVKVPGGGIAGVYSLSEKKPLKTANFPLADQDFEGKTKYSDWVFVYQPKARPIPTKNSASVIQAPG